jgi:acetylglutamate kinase
VVSLLFRRSGALDDAIRKAGVLIEALGWIRRFRGRYVVIKLGGSALEEPAAVRGFLTDVIFLETVGMKPVLVHGGGKDITRAMNEAGIEPRFVHGRRYTDDATLEIAARVLAGEICGSLAAEIERQGARAAALSYLTQNFLIAERLTLKSDGGGELDLGHVGRVVDVNRGVLDSVLAEGRIPVIPSIALDRQGRRLNVNADTAAAQVASRLGAEKLVFLSDVPGILLDRTEPGSLISHLEAVRCKRLIADGTIDSGMVPKIEAALEALDAGVKKVHVIDGRMPHSVLLEVYSDRGVGTEIVP